MIEYNRAITKNKYYRFRIISRTDVKEKNEMQDRYVGDIGYSTT